MRSLPGTRSRGVAASGRLIVVVLAFTTSLRGAHEAMAIEITPRKFDQYIVCDLAAGDPRIDVVTNGKVSNSRDPLDLIATVTVGLAQILKPERRAIKRLLDGAEGKQRARLRAKLVSVNRTIRGFRKQIRFAERCESMAVANGSTFRS